MSSHKGYTVMGLILTMGLNCSAQNIGHALPGMIIHRQPQTTKYCVYQNSTVPYQCIGGKGKGAIDYGSFTWLHTSNKLLGSALMEPGTGFFKDRCDIMEFKTTGEPTRVLYQAIDGELAWPEFPSWDDRFLLFTTHHLQDPNEQPFEALMPMLALKVLDMKSGEVVHVIDSVGRPPSYQMHESPWLHDGQRFVWSIRHATRLIDNEGDVFPLGSGRNGIHMFDMRTGTVTLLVEGAEMAVVSPMVNVLAYIKENKLCLFDMESSIERIVFTFTQDEQIRTIHWSPDSTAIFVGSAEKRSIKERLIDVETSQELPFTSIGMTNGTYSWK